MEKKTKEKINSTLWYIGLLMLTVFLAISAIKYVLSNTVEMPEEKINISVDIPEIKCRYQPVGEYSMKLQDCNAPHDEGNEPCPVVDIIWCRGDICQK